MTVRNPLVLIPGGNPQIQELPAGDTIGGAPQGLAGLIWRGAWSSLTAFAVNDGVSYLGGSYISIQAGTNHLPTDTAFWQPLAAKGDVGAAGASGTNSGANFICNGRLTLTTGVPVTTSDVTGATTIYFTPFRGNQISTYDSSVWTGHTFTEISIPLGTLTNGKNYDLFVYTNSGVLTLELSAAWTNDTTRADALALQDGVYVKSADHSRRYLGTFRTTSTTTTEDSAGGVTTQVGGKRFLWNYYNRASRSASVIDTTDTWTYNTNTIRQANGAAGNKIEYVCGIVEDPIAALLVASAGGGSARTGATGIGVNSTTTYSGIFQMYYIAAGFPGNMTASYNGFGGLGYNYISWNERGADTGSFFGDNGGVAQSGLNVSVMG